MLLKTLEIKGFKSFGDRVVVHFGEGVTGIVGPNGCGKSNIVDAIRWVLGEQKLRNLRSDKMESVIFNGTKTRKAQQMAEVSLTFENNRGVLPTEYSQVQIGRRYYRSGESEYLLNGVTCRHKDITSLFLDTGIGSDSYAIIELKMVDDLLNDRDDSRRGLFEEAAGVSKFRIRKKETLKKLEDTTRDLDRVEDLLFEITKNLKMLEKQAKQAEQYFVVKEEYKRASVELGKFLLFDSSEKLQRIQKQLREVEEAHAALAAQQANTEAEIDRLKNTLGADEQLLRSRQITLNDHINKIRGYESERKIKDEQVKLLSEKLESLRVSLEEDEKKTKNLNLRLEVLNSEIETEVRLLAEKETGLESLQTRVAEGKKEVNEKQDAARDAGIELRKVQDLEFKLKNSIELAKVQMATLERELENQAGDAAKQQESLSLFSSKLEKLDSEIISVKEKLENAIAAEKHQSEQLTGIMSQWEEAREKLMKLNREYDARQHELNLTKGLVENLEGYPEALRFLKKSQSWVMNAPLLSDLFTCDDTYKVAIESYLDNWMNYFVVEDEQQALQGINLLGKAGKGRAHFFLLKQFENKELAYAPAFEGAVHAPDIVEFDPAYKSLMLHLLGGVFIVADDKLPEHPEFTFISQSGHIVRKKQSLSGGSVGIFEGKKIGRAKHLEKLQKQQEVQSKEIEKVRNLVAQLHGQQQELRKEDRKQEISRLQRLLSQLEQERAGVASRSEQTAQFIANFSLRSEEAKAKVTSLQEEVKTALPELEAAREQLNAKDLIFESAQREAQLIAEGFSGINQEFNGLNLQVIQQRNGLKIRQNEAEYKQNELNESLSRLNKHQAELQETEARVREVMEKSVVKDDQLLMLYEEKDAIEAGMKEAEEAYYQTRGIIDSLEKAIRELGRSKEQNDTLKSSLQQSGSEIKISLQNIMNRVSVEFGVDLEDIDLDNYDGGLYSEEELQAQVQKVKGKMEKLGPINPIAVEAYTEMKERFETIQTQKNDILEAKKSLLSTIQEIDGVANTTFLDTFNQIRENFIKVFRTLFTEEDSCDLVLSNPGAPLESSIEIMARPKGKRPLTINQLSGGEKTLTAISLLFAIYLVKPAPFCIFDEVDAPLDDANIDKFNNIIRTFSDDSQFIIVTHNKRTMASTDVMYGITMQEPGVSRAIPVDFRTLPV